jgi:hypothetical protein
MDGEAAAAKLRRELARLQAGTAFEVLGVPPHASGEAVRAAFISLTKKFHPNRFARESPEVLDLSTEIFLLVRRAYGAISDDAKRQALREKMMGVLVPPTSPPQGAKPQTQPPAGPRPQTSPPAAAKPQTQPPVGPRPEAAPMARPATTPPAPRPPSAAASPPAATPPAPHKPLVMPLGGPPPPTAARAAGTQPPRATNPPDPKKAAEVKALLDAAKTRQIRLDQGNRMLREGRWSQAREIFKQLAAEDPQSRKVRQRYQLALGLEHRAEKRFDEAVRELERALSLDPTADDVAEALRVTRDQRDAARAGLFSKLFGR